MTMATATKTIMDFTNDVDTTVAAVLWAVEQANVDDLAEEAHNVKADIRTHIRTLLEVLDAIDAKLES
jgi:hypothetical protein